MNYIANVGINYPDGDGERRIECGEDVPAAVVERSPWLLEQGYVAVIGETEVKAYVCESPREG